MLISNMQNVTKFKSKTANKKIACRKDLWFLIFSKFSVLLVSKAIQIPIYQQL